MVTYSPFVYWAQNETNIFVKIDLKDVQGTKINIEEKKLEFKCKGSGAQGFKDYAFYIDFYSNLADENNNAKITDHKVELTLKKAQKKWWPRLTSQPQKPAWLKIDFDRWISEDDILDEEVKDICEDYPDLYEKLQKEEIGYRKEGFKKVYLTFYNLFMYVGFMYILCVLCIKHSREGTDFYRSTYKVVGPVMCFVQLLQILEIMHPIFGYVKGNALLPFLQIAGRNFILFGVIHQEPRIQEMPVTFYLFLTWSTIEIIRYPYYISQLYKKNNGILTWLRYSAWIVLYPGGFICEAVTIFRYLIFVDTSGKWSVSLPNSWNFTFHFASFLRIYLLFLFLPGIYFLLSHMYKARQQKLGTKCISSKFKRS